MRLDQLNYVMQVDRYKSINETAKHLFVSQSTISTAITSLEDELGIKIFNRSKYGVTPTTEGQSILEEIIPIFQHIDRIQKISSEQPNHLKSYLKLATIKDFMCPTNLSILHKLRNQYPSADFIIEEKRVPIVIDLIQKGNYDIGIVHCERNIEASFLKKISSEGLAYRFLYEDQLAAYCSKLHPLAQKKTITFSDLMEYPLIAYSNKGVFPSICDLERSFIMESSDYKKLLLDNPRDIAFQSALSMEGDIYFTSGELVRLNILDLKIPSSIWAIYKKDIVLSYIENDFLQAF